MFCHAHTKSGGYYVYRKSYKLAHLNIGTFYSSQTPDIYIFFFFNFENSMKKVEQAKLFLN